MRKVPLKITFLALSAVFAGVACSGEGTAADPSAPATAATTPAADVADANDANDAQAGEPSPEQHVQLVRFGAVMHVAGDLCGLSYADGERERLREQQKEAMVAAGDLSATQFDAAFDAGIREARQALENASEAERAQTCDNLRRMREGAPQG